jgi:predicted amidohydrolase
VSRRLKVSSAQLGPINLADSRASVVKRMVEMLKEADSRGSKFVVFPELALTTFFPRYWYDDPNEVEKYFENQMPSPETQPLFELARSKGIGFYLGYAERTEEKGKPHHFNTSILVGPDGRLVGKYRRSICRAMTTIVRTCPTSTSRRSTSRSAISASTSGRCSRTTCGSASASATIAAGPRPSAS